jgi:putative MATE family efflux protein
MKRAVIPIAATSILNIILDPIFIYQLNMGIEGAAIATVISSAVSILIMAYWIWIKKDLFLDLSPKNFKYDSQMMKDTLHVAIPSTLENILFSTLAVIVNTMLVIVAGTDAVAAYTAAMRIVQMCMIPMMGIGTALLTIAGVAYGAHNYKNLKIGYNYAVKQGFIISIVLAILMIVFCNQISSIFAYTSASASLGPQIAYSIRILSLFVVAIPHGIMSSMMFQGVGKGPKALKITLLRSLAFESILAYLFGFILNFGLIGIYAGIILGCFLGGTVGFIWSKFFIDKFQVESKDRYEGVPAK